MQGRLGDGAIGPAQEPPRGSHTVLREGFSCSYRLLRESEQMRPWCHWLDFSLPHQVLSSHHENVLFGLGMNWFYGNNFHPWFPVPPRGLHSGSRSFFNYLGFWVKMVLGFENVPFRSRLGEGACTFLAALSSIWFRVLLWSGPSSTSNTTRLE